MNKNRNTKMSILLFVAYIIIVAIFLFGIFSLPFAYNAMQTAYVDEVRDELVDIFENEYASEADLLQIVERTVEKYPMELMITGSDDEVVFATALVENTTDKTTRLDKRLVLVEGSALVQMDGLKYNVWYSVYQLQAQDFLTGISRFQLVLMGGSFLILLGIIVLLHRTLIRSLKEVRASVEKIGAYQLDEVAVAPSNDVIHLKLNRFAKDLKENIVHVSQEHADLEKALFVERERLSNLLFVSRAFVHDLKTPVHQSILENEYRLQHDDSASSAVLEMANYNIEQADMVLGMINDVLQLLQMEYVDDMEHVDDFDVVDLVMSSKRMFAAVIKQRKLSFELEVPEVLLVRLNKVMVQLLVHNLLANSLQYATPGSHVYMAVHQENGMLSLVCTNDACDEHILRMQQSEEVQYFTHKLDDEHTYSSGQGLFLIKDLVATMKGEYDCIFEDNCIHIHINIPVE